MERNGRFAVPPRFALEQNNARPPDVKESLSLVRRNVELEARLIDDLLDLTRIARGKMELHLKETDFHSVIHRALEICRAEFKAKSGRIVVELKASEHEGAGDAVRVQQAVWNVLRNAVKFTPEHGRITVRTTNPRASCVISRSLFDSIVSARPLRNSTCESGDPTKL